MSRAEAFVAGVLLALLVALGAWGSTLNPPPVDAPGKWQTVTKGAILYRCPHCGNLAIIQVPDGTRFRIRTVEPLPEVGSYLR